MVRVGTVLCDHNGPENRWSLAKYQTRVTLNQKGNACSFCDVALKPASHTFLAWRRFMELFGTLNFAN